MKLSIETIRAISIGAVEVEEKENGFSFHRFTKELRITRRFLHPQV